MRFKDIGNRFKVRMRREDGSFFYGALSLPTISNNRTTDFTPTRRLLRVDDGVKMTAGVIFFTPKNVPFLTAINGEDEYIRSDLNTFRCVEVNKEMEWTRRNRKKNPITGLDEGDEVVSFGYIWAALEPDGQTLDTLKVIKKDFRIITNADVKEGDYIGKYRALRVDKVLGVNNVHV